MEELIKRLRNRRICIQQSGGLDDFPLLEEAADAIEKLELYAELYKDGGESAMKVVKDYKEQIDNMKDTVKRQSDMI